MNISIQWYCSSGATSLSFSCSRAKQTVKSRLSRLALNGKSWDLTCHGQSVVVWKCNIRWHFVNHSSMMTFSQNQLSNLVVHIELRIFFLFTSLSKKCYKVYMSMKKYFLCATSTFSRPFALFYTLQKLKAHASVCLFFYIVHSCNWTCTFHFI